MRRQDLFDYMWGGYLLLKLVVGPDGFVYCTNTSLERGVSVGF
jgi:hypothetical protein